MRGHDVDFVIIGSGFGGSVAALRLAEKGYSVVVLESGRRFADDELPTSTADVRRYFFFPRLGMNGILRLNFFKDVTIASGAGVGGGSLGYANTLYRASKDFYAHPQWAGLETDWSAALAPFYDEAERILGVTEVTTDDPADDLLRAFGEELGVGDSYAKTRVGVYFGDGPGISRPDPFFGGAGPDRTGCQLCARCMVGCPHGAKNTLIKNYLHLAEQLGVEVRPETEAVEIRPLGASDGSDGYAVTTRHPARRPGSVPTTLHAANVVVSAGALGTNKLLAACKLGRSLPNLSERLGQLVRTNSEAILAVTLPKELPGMTRRVAITGSIYPDEHTHIETVTYGDAGSSMRWLYTLMVGDGSRLTRPLQLFGQMLRHPHALIALLGARDWSRRTVTVLVMQSLDNAISLRPRRTRHGAVRLRTEQDPERPNPTFIPVANQAAGWIAEQTGGTAQSSLAEAIANIPTTAHVLGGAVIGASSADGVVDSEHRVFDYEGLYVCDGSVVPANPGVNPSLTITALAERAMSRIPPRGPERGRCNDHREPLVLIHGLGSSRRVWSALLPALADRFDVLALDLPGFGAAPLLPPGVEPTVDAFTDHVERAMTSAGWDTAHLAGSSMGGWIALELAKRDRARSATVFSPAGLGTPVENARASASLRLSAWLGHLLAPFAEILMRPARLRRLLQAQYAAHAERRDPADAASDLRALARRGSFDEARRWLFRHSAGELDRIGCPVQIVWGDRDRLLPVRQAQRFAAAIAGANVTVLSGAGHLPMIDAADAVARLIQDVLDTRPAAAAAV
jgi:cholesterol oxidase